MENRLDDLPETRGPGLSVEDRLRRRYASPEARLAFDRAVDAKVATAELVAAVEEARAALGVSKASLATKTGRSASVVSRILNSKLSNPTVLTVFEILEAMDLRVRVTIEEPRRRRTRADRPVVIESAISKGISETFGESVRLKRASGRRSATTV